VDGPFFILSPACPQLVGGAVHSKAGTRLSTWLHRVFHFHPAARERQERMSNKLVVDCSNEIGFEYRQSVGSQYDYF